MASKCVACALDAANKAREVTTPILSGGIMHGVQIDLMDIRSQQDGNGNGSYKERINSFAISDYGR